MRVGILVERFDRRRGGLEQWAARFVPALLERGVETHVVSFEFGDPAPTSGLFLHHLNDGGSRFARASAAHDLLAKLDLDVVHDCGVGWLCDVLHLHAGSRREALARTVRSLPRWRRPLAHLRRRASANFREMLRLETRQVAHADSLILLPSRMVRDDLVRRHRVAPQRLRVIPNGVDTERFSPRHRATHRERVRRELGVGGETLFFTLAHNPVLKGVPAAIRALAALRREGRPASLVAAGGKDPEPLRRLARSLGVESAVHVLGAVGDPVPYFAAADAFLHASLQDACSLVVLEASASGVAVAVSRFDGAAELLEGSAGAFVLDDPADWRGLASVMSRLCDGTLSEDMGRAARQSALAFGFDRHVAAVTELYREICERRGRRAADGRDG